MTEQDWQARWYIYRFFIDQERPPTFEELASHFGIAPVEARDIFYRLNAAHAVLLDGDRVRMAHPLSAVPTDYRVQVEHRRYWANCAWDSLGIAAMLNADADIEAQLPLSGEIIHCRVRHGTLEAAPGYLVHFSLPVRNWYDDLVHT